RSHTNPLWAVAGYRGPCYRFWFAQNMPSSDPSNGSATCADRPATSSFNLSGFLTMPSTHTVARFARRAVCSTDARPYPLHAPAVSDGGQLTWRQLYPYAGLEA